MLLITHSFAYFTYDSIIEIYYGTDDLLTNAHHIVVVTATFFHMMNKYGGFEYVGTSLIFTLFPILSIWIVLHLMAEVSNPFLIFRTVLKIVGMKETKIYDVNDIIFATVFLIVRMFMTPFALIYLFEGVNILFADKLGISFVLYI